MASKNSCFGVVALLVALAGVCCGEARALSPLPPPQTVYIDFTGEYSSRNSTTPANGNYWNRVTAEQLNAAPDFWSSVAVRDSFDKPTLLTFGSDASDEYPWIDTEVPDASSPTGLRLAGVGPQLTPFSLQTSQAALTFHRLTKLEELIVYVSASGAIADDAIAFYERWDEGGWWDSYERVFQYAEPESADVIPPLTRVLPTGDGETLNSDYGLRFTSGLPYGPGANLALIGGPTLSMVIASGWVPPSYRISAIEIRGEFRLAPEPASGLLLASLLVPATLVRRRSSRR